MTREEAIEELRDEISFNISEWGKEDAKETIEALNMAIEALKAPEILTADDLRLMRKVLACVNTLYTVAEPEYKENKIDLLLRKLRALEEKNGE